MIGTQGFEAYKMVKDVTKYSNVVMDGNDILYELEKSLHISKSGRPGPVWLDIPFDVQSSPVNEYNLDIQFNLYTKSNIEYKNKNLEVSYYE